MPMRSIVRSATKVTRGSDRRRPAAARHRARRHRRRQRRSRRRDRARHRRDERARRQQHQRRRTGAWRFILALARPIPAADAAMKTAEVGEEEVRRQRGARQDARHRRARAHRAGSGAARARVRDADCGARSRTSPRRLAAQYGARLGTLDEVCAAADYLTLHLPVTRGRRGTSSTPNGWHAASSGIRIVQHRAR